MCKFDNYSISLQFVFVGMGEAINNLVQIVFALYLFVAFGEMMSPPST